MPLQVKCYDNKKVKSPYNWIIYPLTKPQVANHQKIKKPLVKKMFCFIFLHESLQAPYDMEKFPLSLPPPLPTLVSFAKNGQPNFLKQNI